MVYYKSIRSGSKTLVCSLNKPTIGVKMARVDDFRSMLTGGVRGNQFRVLLTFPNSLNVNSVYVAQQTEFLAHGAELPGSYISRLEVPYMGRWVRVAGLREFDTWKIEIFNTADMSIRKAMELWSASVAGHSDIAGTRSPADYTTDMQVQQLDRNDVILRTYTIHNCFPMRIEPIKLSFSDNSSIESFNVEFSMDYWTVDDGDSQIN